MNRSRSILVVALALSSVHSARASLTDVAADASAKRSSPPAAFRLADDSPDDGMAVGVHVADAGLGSNVLDLLLADSLVAEDGNPLTPGDGVNHRQVLDLPAPPSSTSLFLSAMVSVGAWHLVRWRRDSRLGAVPDWYHTGGPVQIGHATPFDLDFNHLVWCPLDTPVSPQGVTLSGFGWSEPSRVTLQPPLAAAGSRGPPASAS
ncbi:MAG: hypothetical protein ACE5EX_01355 [Phycisphaerae bacterium]